MIFLKAFIIGFSIAMPVGPIGMLCIKNTLAHGFRIGLAVGLGAALADSFYGLLAGGGLAFISQFLLDYSAIIKTFGGVALIYLGASEIKNRAAHGAQAHLKAKGFYKTILGTFFLTLTSPATILSYVGIFAAIGGTILTGSNIAIMITGVFLGSLTWWLILAKTVAATRHKIPQSFMVRIKVISGLILIGFGAYALLGL